MNLGLYEIMDRIAVIQDQIDNNLYHHQEGDKCLQSILDSAQEDLGDAYQYIANKYNESCEGVNGYGGTDV